ncbi:hypothetical protein, partial [Xanthomonas citri]|uniref:hypothetical protein n=1 Tax=Xanthomonas citri TaxID=346 RepID=UPI001A8F07F8
GDGRLAPLLATAENGGITPAELAMAFSAPAVARSNPEEDRPGSFAWVKFRAFFAGQVDPPRANDFSRYSNPHGTE